jgi:hypothetical protein
MASDYSKGEDEASFPLAKWPQHAINATRLYTGDANQIRNSNPQHFIFPYAFVYHFSNYALWQAWLYHGTRKLPGLG